MPNPTNSAFLTAAKGSQYIFEQYGIKVSANTLRARAAKNEIAHAKLGTRYFFTVEHLNAVIVVNEPHNAQDIA